MAIYNPYLEIKLKGYKAIPDFSFSKDMDMGGGYIHRKYNRLTNADGAIGINLTGLGRLLTVIVKTTQDLRVVFKTPMRDKELDINGFYYCELESNLGASITSLNLIALTTNATDVEIYIISKDEE